jgi:geranylgeranylglycerol-phosphate geranylgeranyltransferase
MPKMQLQGLKTKKQRKKGQGYKSLVGLIRPFNCFLASLATVAGFNLISTPNLITLWAALAVFFVTGGGNVINDFFDIKRDKINKPNRPLPSGKIKPGYAVGISIILFSIGLFFAYLVNIELFYLAILAASTLIIYSGVIKEYKFFGNIIVSILVGLTFIAGSLAAGNWKGGIILAFLASMVNWSREILKDLEERSPEKWTLSALLGKFRASLTATALIFLGILAAMYMTLGFSLFKQVLFILAIISWIYTIIKYREPRIAQKFIKVGMGLIVLALLLPQ